MSSWASELRSSHLHKEDFICWVSSLAPDLKFLCSISVWSSVLQFLSDITPIQECWSWRMKGKGWRRYVTLAESVYFLSINGSWRDDWFVRKKELRDVNHLETAWHTGSTQNNYLGVVVEVTVNLIASFANSCLIYTFSKATRLWSQKLTSPSILFQWESINWMGHFHAYHLLCTLQL